MTKNKKINLTMMIVFIFMNFVLSMSSTLFNGILDKMVIDLNVSLSKVGYLTSFYAFGAGIGVPIFLIIFNKKETSLLLKIMLALNIIVTLFSIMAPTFELLLITRFFMGLAGNCYSVLATLMIASLSPKEKVGKNLSLLIAGAAAALMVGVPLTRELVVLYSWKFVFLGLIFIMLLSLAYFIFYLPKGTHQKEVNLKLELQFLKERKVLLVRISSIVTFIGYGGIYTYLTPYIIHQFSYFEGYTSVFLMIIGLSSFIGNLIGGFFCDRFGFYKSLVGGSFLQVCLSFIIFMTNTSFVIQLVMICLWMVNGWFIGLQINTAITIVTQNKSSLMISLNSSGIQLGQVLGTSIAAMIITKANISFIVLLSTVTSIIVFIILNANQKMKI